MKQTPSNSIKIEMCKWTKSLKFVEKIVRSPCMKPKKSLTGSKKPLILLSAGSFLGYHKDGKVTGKMNLSCIN